MGGFFSSPFMGGIFGLQPQAQQAGAPAQPNPGSNMNAAAASAQPNAAAFGALRGLFGAPQQNATLGQMIGGLGGGMPGQQPGWGMTPFGAQMQRAAAAQQPPGTQTLGGVLSGLLGRGAPGNPMMPGQQPNLAAPPFAGRFRMF